MKSTVLTILLVAAITASIIGYLSTVGTIELRGVVNVPYPKPVKSVEMVPSTIELSVTIDSAEGSKTFTVGKLYVRRGTFIIVKPVYRRVSGNLSILLSGALLLDGERRYRIPLPCLVVRGETCYRILSIIPGYDVPLWIEPGVYTVSITVTWRAYGRGDFVVKLAVVEARRIIVIQNSSAEPTPGHGWLPANGSTRSYGVFVEKTSSTTGPDGYGTTTLWIWYLKTAATGRGDVVVEVTDGNSTLYKTTVTPRECGVYYQTVLTIKALPGQYTIHVLLPNNREIRIPFTVLNSTKPGT